MHGMQLKNNISIELYSMLLSVLLRDRYTQGTVACMLFGSAQVSLQLRYGSQGSNLPQIAIGCVQLRLQLLVLLHSLSLLL